MAGYRTKLIVFVGLFLVSPLIVTSQSTNQIEKNPASVGMTEDEFAQLALRARAYWDKGDYTNARPLFEQVLQITEKELGEDSPLLARQLIVLATIYSAQGDSAKALTHLKRSLAVGEKMEGKEGFEETMIPTLLHMGLAYRSLAKYPEATSAFQRCLGIQEKTYGTDSTNCCSSLKALADLYSSQADYDKALTNYARWLQITQKAFGINDPSVAVVANNVAHVHKEKGDYAKAFGMYLWALGAYEKAHGSNDVGVATILNNIAEIHLLQGYYEDALLTCQRGLAIREKSLGGEHRDVVTSLATLAMIHENLGKKEEAIHLWERCFEIEEKLSGTDDVQFAIVLSALAGLYREQGNYGRALILIQRSLKINVTIFGEEHPSVADGLEELASLYLAEGKQKQARPLLVRAFAINAKTFGMGHPSVIHSTFNLALLDVDENELARSFDGFRLTFWQERQYFCDQVMRLSDADGIRLSSAIFFKGAVLHSLCGLGVSNNLSIGKSFGAEQLAINKALLEEVQAARAALEADPATATQELNKRFSAVNVQLSRLPETSLDPLERDKQRRELEAELNQLSAKVAEQVRRVEQATKEWTCTLEKVAESLPIESALVDFVQYRRYDFAAKTNQWKEQRYAAYLTFPLAHGATNVVVERVDLGEAAPINEAVELVCQRMAAGQFAAKDLAAALQRLSQLVYAPLAPHLTNVAHLIVCPDGQLSRLPFEMLPVGNKFLLEEKTISYVTSGREVVRLANQTNSKPETRNSKSLVMGNPDFDLDLSARSRRREEAEISRSPDQTAKPEGIRLLASAATRALSRDYRGARFTPLPGSGVEATNVAKLLGSDAVLRLGPDAREAELKAVVSPRVLHLATHGFFLSDQEFKHTNSPVGSPAFTRPGLPEGRTPNDWENPMVRCGIALAGANHARQITNAVAEDGLLTGLEASLLNLQGTELVILSACDSGTGEVKIGEGVMSLRRAFRIAGAESVLASHWPVSDKATSRLMTEFMRRWRAGEPRAKAWREAQLELLRSKGTKEDFSNPYFWAAFTLTGQWN